jgi:hypothetical protein
VIDHIQALAGRPIRVLILFHGVDGSTTNNNSWWYLIHRFPDVRFSLAPIATRQMANLYPSVFTMGGDYSWAHIDVDDLYTHISEISRGTDTTIMFLRSPKVTRFVFWLTVLYM